MTQFSIQPLSEHPDFVETCAAWSFGEWGCLLEGKTLEQTIEGYKKKIKDTDLPVSWIAIDQNKPIGMASLSKEDHPDRKDLSPWLASLFVHPEFRGKGCGKALARHVEQQAKEVYGYKKCYLFTRTAQTLYEKMDWKAVKSLRDPIGLSPDGVMLMEKAL